MSGGGLTSVASLVNQLGLALERGDRASLNDIIRQLVAVRAPMGDQWQQLALLAAGNGEISLARQAIDLLVRAMGGGAEAQYQKVALLALLGDWREAYALVRAIPSSVPDQAGNAYSRGVTALNLGKAEEARGYLEDVVQMRPQSGLAWFSLSLSADMALASDLADRLIAAAPGMETMPASERVPYQYALGHTYAARRDHARAFEAFSSGARLMRATLSHDRHADQADAARAIDGYSAARIADIASLQSEQTGRTIFVTGLPRSGTTLVEHILTHHSQVHDGGEIGRLALLAGDIGGAAFPALERYVRAQGAASAARLWHHWLDERFPGAQRIVDKTVTTSRFLGLAASLLPDAPLIWMTRDPIDRAWSCFRTNFMGGAMPWSYDLEDIAAHFRIEDQLLAQWQDILGDRLLVLSYEALVSDPERWIPRILAHCGLAEEPQMLAPHENERPVPTASMMQVRRPINRAAIGSAEPYRPYLEPFIAAYRRA